VVELTTVLLVVVAFVAGYALGRWRSGGARVVWQSGPHDQPAGADVEELVRRGRKIEAIRRYREQHGVGLKDAKDAVDRVEATLRAGQAPQRGRHR
jgi:ribosomal protein L7/L12